MKRIFAFLFAAACCLLTLAATAQTPTRFFDPTVGVTRSVLPNGMTVLVKERRDSPAVVSFLAYRVGIRNEQLGLTGLSHYLEHMLFKGTRRLKKGEIDLITLKNGGENNAYTTADFTAYWFKFASDRWEAALEIEADRMRNCTFLQEEFDPEKQVVIEELQGGLDGPWEALEQAVWAAAFTQHPYHAPIIGWFQDVKRATRDDMKAYYDRWYHPRNATLVIVGDVRAPDVLAKVKKLFGKIPAGPEAQPQRVVEPPQRGERRVVVKKETQLERLMMAFHTPQIAHPDSYALEIVSTLLGTGKTSRLWQRLMERDKSVTTFGCHFDERYDPSLFSFWAELKAAQQLADVEAAIADEIQQLAARSVTPAELARAKKLIEASFIMGQEDAMSQANLLGTAEMLVAHPDIPEGERGYRYLQKYLERIHAVTAEDVHRVVKKYLRADNRTVGWLVKDAEREGEERMAERENGRAGEGVARPSSPTESRFEDVCCSGASVKRRCVDSKIKSALHRSAATSFRSSANPKSKIENPKLRVERFVLPNGLTVLLSENRATPVVSIAASVNAGARFEPDDKAGLAALVGELLQEGTQRRTSQQIAEAIESVGGELSSSGGYARSGVNARVLSKDFDLALELVLDLLMRANFPEDRVKDLVARRLDEIKSRADSPVTVASDAFNEIVFAGHPARRPVVGYEKTVGAITRDDIVTFYRRHFLPTNTVLAVVGDFDPKTVRAKIEKAFGGWTQENIHEAIYVPEISRQTKPQEKVIELDREQTNIFVGHLGIKRDNPDFYALQVLETILGNTPGFTSRIPRILRDEQGLAYSAYCSMVGSAGVDAGRFIAFIGCSPENSQKALDGLRREIARIVEKPVTAQELADAKAYLTGSFLLGLETNAQIAGFLLNAEIYKLGFDYPEKYRKQIESVTIADVARVAKKYIAPDALTTVIVGPKLKK
jgi:zinc protease